MLIDQLCVSQRKNEVFVIESEESNKIIDQMYVENESLKETIAIQKLTI